MNCLLCNKRISYRLTLKDLFSFQEIITPVICDDCKNSFIPWNGKRCAGCGSNNLDEKCQLCAECQRWEQMYGWYLPHQGLYHYNDAMRAYMQRYKFNGDYRLRMVFQRELSKIINDYQVDLVIPIPVTLTTMQTRGFNQVVGLLREGSYQLLLQTRTKSKIAQSSKTREERLATEQPFVLGPSAQISGERVLLVDDVYTTGRTLYHAAVLFKQAGCEWVGSVSLAR